MSHDDILLERQTLFHTPLNISHDSPDAEYTRPIHKEQSPQLLRPELEMKVWRQIRQKSIGVRVTLDFDELRNLPR